MKRSFFLFMLVAPVAWALETHSIRIGSEISSAIVYLDGAEIVRHKTVDLRKGRNELIFEGLSPKINEKTIQIYTQAGVEVLSITSRINYLTLAASSSRTGQLLDSVELITARINNLNDQRNAYEQEKNLLQTNMSLGGTDRGVVITELKEAADFYRNRILEINRKISELNRQTGEDSEVLNKLRMQLNELNNRNNIQRGEITILVNADADVKAPVELHYLVREVGWIPAYDIRATDISEPIQLVYRAKVYNNSDIDWKQVKLKLSSADPNLSASKPVLTPWHLNYQQEQITLQNAYSQQAGALPKVPGAAAMSDAPMEFQAPQLNTFQKGSMTFTNIAISDINAEFDIADKYSIPSDAKPYFIEIKEYELKADYKHYTIPKLSCDAFLLARITGWEDLDILEGTANIYLNGTYTGQSFINTREVNDTLDISLGRDKKVYVHRKKQMEFSSTKLIGTNRKETFAYEIVLKNNHKVPVNIDVIDQLPVPQNSDIEVDKLELSGAAHNELTGELTWSYNIAPAETKKIDLSFAIKSPKSRPVNTKVTKFRSVRYF